MLPAIYILTYFLVQFILKYECSCETVCRGFSTIHMLDNEGIWEIGVETEKAVNIRELNNNYITFYSLVDCSVIVNTW